MSKYDPLGQFLKKQNSEMVPMTFREIERVTGTRLPASKRYPAWWSNNAWNNVMTKVWLEAGFRSEQVDVARERLVFRRDAAAPKKGRSERTDPPAKSGPYPLVGALRGSFTIEPGWDISRPALDDEAASAFEQSIDRTADLIDSGLRSGRQ
jgi:hypothetical protein